MLTRLSRLIVGHRAGKSVLASATASPRALASLLTLSRVPWKGSEDETHPFDVTPNGMGGIDMVYRHGMLNYRFSIWICNKQLNGHTALLFQGEKRAIWVWAVWQFLTKGNFLVKMAAIVDLLY